MRSSKGKGGAKGLAGARGAAKAVTKAGRNRRKALRPATVSRSFIRALIASADREPRGAAGGGRSGLGGRARRPAPKVIAGSTPPLAARPSWLPQGGRAPAG